MDPASNFDTTASLKEKLQNSSLPEELKSSLENKLAGVEAILRSSAMGVVGADAGKELRYLEFILALPFGKSSQDILDLKRAGSILNKNHYGLLSAKEKILEYLSVLILNARQNLTYHSAVLALVGLVGSGKTSLAYSIAESLGRQIIRIPFGGVGSVALLRGESRVRAEAQAGQILKALVKAQVNNPVILLDEIDRVAAEARADIMGVLVELLDPEQNSSFLDYYADYPFDLSKILFIATANNIGNIATAVLDRLETVEMPAYSDEEKMMIAKNYLLPKSVKEAGLLEGTVQIDETVWPQIIRPLGFDGGIRSLQRTIKGIVARIARKVVTGERGPFILNSSNLQEYLPG